MITVSTDEKDKRAADDEGLLALARDRFQQAAEAESRTRELALEDLRFRAGDQWPADLKTARDLDKRPCLTVNRIPQFIKQVTNEQRQNRPAIQINPVGDGADLETAEVLSGLVRHIENNSGAGVADDTAFEHAAIMGFGHTRVVTDYVDDDSFDQEIQIKRIKNPFTVYFDPSVQEADYSDARFAFVVEDLTEEEYRGQYPDSQLAGLSEFASIGDRSTGWITARNVRVAEYFYIERKRKKIALLGDGRRVPAGTVPAGAHVVKVRDTKIQTVNWCKINGIEVLERREWPGKWIPIIPVLGDDLDIDGERFLAGMVRDAKDPARAYNVWTSAMTESIALAPRAPYVAAEGQIEGHEDIWRQANTRNIPVLPYKPKALGNVLVPPPARQVYEPPVMAISNALGHADNDLKSVMGIYDASLGKRGPEESGRAVLARKQQGDTANLNYSDNLARAIRHRGRIIVDLIPHIYDAPRVMKIVDPDGSHRMVAVNQQTMAAGVAKIFDLTTGRYDVTVSVGPSYQTRRQESSEAMLQLLATDPQLWQVIGDLVTANMDWPGAHEISERLKKALPPQFRDPEDGQAPPLPPQVQQQLTQGGQMIQQLTQTVHQLQNEIDAKTVETQSRERIAAMQEETKRTIALATLDAQRGETLLQAEIGSIDKRLTLVGDAHKQQAAREHQRSMASQQQQHDAQRQASDQSHASAQSAQQQQHDAEQAQLSQDAMPEAA